VTGGGVAFVARVRDARDAVWDFVAMGAPLGGVISKISDEAATS
jgi:hypothetical protein